jgi:hypothetical protein
MVSPTFLAASCSERSLTFCSPSSSCQNDVRCSSLHETSWKRQLLEVYRLEEGVCDHHSAVAKEINLR